MNELKTKWVLFDDNYEKYGEITNTVGLDHFLIRIHSSSPPFQEFHHLDDLTNSFIFDTREELESFLKWADETNLKIVSINKDKV